MIKQNFKNIFTTLLTLFLLSVFSQFSYANRAKNHPKNHPDLKSLKEGIATLKYSSLYPLTDQEILQVGILFLESEFRNIQVKYQNHRLLLKCNRPLKQCPYQRKKKIFKASHSISTQFYLAIRWLSAPLNTQKCCSKKIDLLLKKLSQKSGDPFTAYYSAAQIQKLRNPLNAYESPLGIAPKNPQRITDILLLSDAERYNIKNAQTILAINQKNTEKMSYADINLALRGHKNSSLRLHLLDQNGEHLQILLARRQPADPIPVFYLLKNGILYLRPGRFKKGMAATISKQLENNKSKGIILDLRHNHGGNFYESIALLDLFLGEETLGGIRSGKPHFKHDFKTSSSKDDEKRPMVVLIDNQSASASEYTALVLQEKKRAAIFGQSSFKKNSLQTKVKLPNGGILKVSNAFYIGSKIHKTTGSKIQNFVGVQPDILLSNNPLRTLLNDHQVLQDSWVQAASKYLLNKNLKNDKKKAKNSKVLTAHIKKNLNAGNFPVTIQQLK